MVSIASAFRNRKYCMQVLNRAILFLPEQILSPLITDKITFNSRNAKEIFQLCTKCNTMQWSMMILNNYTILETMQQHRTRQTQKIHVFTIINCMWPGINIQKVWWIFFVDVNFKSNLHNMEEYKAKQVFQNLNPMWRNFYSKCKYHSKSSKNKVVSSTDLKKSYTLYAS